MANSKRKRTNSDANDGNDSKNGVETKVARPRKKGRKEPRLARKLQCFLDMPLDILYEILSSLNPLDLLRFSRASKTLRGLILNKSSITVWHRAFANAKFYVEEFGTLTEVSEPRLASLLYEGGCQGCGRRATMELDMNVRFRICKKCFVSGYIDHRLLPWETLRLPNPDGRTPDDIRSRKILRLIPMVKQGDLDYLRLRLRGYRWIDRREPGYIRGPYHLYDVELFKVLQAQCAGMKSAEFSEWYATEKGWYGDYRKETKAITRYLKAQQRIKDSAKQKAKRKTVKYYN